MCVCARVSEREGDVFIERASEREWIEKCIERAIERARERERERER